MIFPPVFFFNLLRRAKKTRASIGVSIFVAPHHRVARQAETHAHTHTRVISSSRCVKDCACVLYLEVCFQPAEGEVRVVGGLPSGRGVRGGCCERRGWVPTGSITATHHGNVKSSASASRVCDISSPDSKVVCVWGGSQHGQQRSPSS